MNFSQFRAVAHYLKGNCTEMAWNAQDKLRVKFSALNLDFNTLSPVTLGLRSRRLAHAGIKKGTS